MFDSAWRGNLSGIRRANDGFHDDCFVRLHARRWMRARLEFIWHAIERWRTNRRNTTSSQTRIDAAFRLLPLRTAKGAMRTRIISKLKSLRLKHPEPFFRCAYEMPKTVIASYSMMPLKEQLHV
jgi:hypothetical protein